MFCSLWRQYMPASSKFFHICMLRNIRRLHNGMGNDLFVDFPGWWALLALGYTQPLQHFTSHLVSVRERSHHTNLLTPSITLSFIMYTIREKALWGPPAPFVPPLMVITPCSPLLISLVTEAAAAAFAHWILNGLTPFSLPSIPPFCSNNIATGQSLSPLSLSPFGEYKITLLTVAERWERSRYSVLLLDHTGWRCKMSHRK